MATLTPEAVKAALGKVKDPLFDKDLVTLGYLKDVEIDGERAVIHLQLPTPAHPHKEAIKAEVVEAMKATGCPKFQLDITAEVTTRIGRPGGDRLSGVKNIIAV